MGGIDWALQLQNGFRNADQAVGSGREFWAIQSTEAFHQEFVDEKGLYPDNVAKCYATIQAAIDASVDNRGDVVNVVGEWAITTPILLNKWGITLQGATSWKNVMGGGGSNITCTGVAVSVINVTKAKTQIRDLVLYMNGTGTTKGIEYSSAAPSQSVVSNVAIIKNGGDASEGQGIKFTTVPTRSHFSDLFISGNASGSLRLNQGILGASYSCVFERITIARTTYQAIYNVGTSNDLYKDITILPSCGVGLEIGGVDAASSAIVGCHVLATTPGASTALISQSYIAGLSAYAGT